MAPIGRQNQAMQNHARPSKRSWSISAASNSSLLVCLSDVKLQLVIGHRQVVHLGLQIGLGKRVSRQPVAFEEQGDGILFGRYVDDRFIDQFT